MGPSKKMTKQPSLIALLMIRNEEKIIRRCLASLVDHVDAVCVCDTGSTDRTIERVVSFFATRPLVPYQVAQYEWKNFGESRTESFMRCRDFAQGLGWRLSTTYAIVLDADMTLDLPAGLEFPRNQLTAEGHMLNQQNGNLTYSNTRLLQLSAAWKCTGVTHEYWDGYACPLIPESLVRIRDIGDGGCKDDKYPRDKALLEQGLINEPGNVRYMFYLAQTLKDQGDHTAALAMFRRRIKAGAWAQEVWYSMFQMAKIYDDLRQYPKMEYWAQKAYELDPARSENLYLLARRFRSLSQNHKAWHYMKLGLSIALPATTPLFLDTECYHRNFLYEKTLLNYYVQPSRRRENLMELVAHCNSYGSHPCYINLLHYVDSVPFVDCAPLAVPAIEGFFASSVSVVPCGDTLLANVRYVNYRIDSKGNYIILNNAPVRTRNVFVRHNGQLWQSDAEATEMTADEPPVGNCRIQGIEDLRLFGSTGNLRFVGTSMEYCASRRLSMVSGRYNTDTHRLEDVQYLASPDGLGPVGCEKNWIPLGDVLGVKDDDLGVKNNHYVYRWHPLTVVRSNGSAGTGIVHESQTPKFFENVRGSSGFVQWRDTLLCLVHVVQDITPRKYYHMLVRLTRPSAAPGDFGDLALHSYTLPFFFLDNAIEYVLGCALSRTHQDQLSVFLSRNDADPTVVLLDLDQVEFHAELK